MPNIRTVAKRAGVSTATVSRVLTRPDVVAPGTRRRVLRAVERLRLCAELCGPCICVLRSGKLLVTVPDIANPFFAMILPEIEEAAQRAGYRFRRHPFRAARRSTAHHMHSRCARSARAVRLLLDILDGRPAFRSP